MGWQLCQLLAFEGNDVRSRQAVSGPAAEVGRAILSALVLQEKRKDEHLLSTPACHVLLGDFILF